jgi:hypothetical protein
VRTLLDECVDRRLAKEIQGHEVITVPQAGWAGLQSGALLRRAQDRFDVLVTVDRNLSFQQPVAQFAIAVIVLEAPSNRLQDLRSLVSQLQRILPTAPKGQVSRVGGNS